MHMISRIILMETNAKATIRPSAIQLILFALLWSTAISPSQATSILFPKFSEPIFQEDRLLFASPDSKRLICVNVGGAKQWDLTFHKPVNLFAGPKGEALLQTGIVVNAVSPKDGTLKQQFVVESENDRVSYDKAAESFVSRDSRFEVRAFRLLKAETGKPVWKSASVESVVCSTPSLIVCLSVGRIRSGEGYYFGQGHLEAFDRRDFSKKWTVALDSKEDLPWLQSCYTPPYLVYLDGRSLITIDSASGTKIASKTIDTKRLGPSTKLAKDGENAVWISSELKMGDFSNSAHEFHFCSVPDLNQKDTLTIRLIEVARVSFEEGFIITDALYRTAGFKRDGVKIWELFQNNRSRVIDGKIYFSDYENEAARVGLVDVSTGLKTILYTEKVESPSKASGKK